MAHEPTKPKLPDAYFDLGISPAASAVEIKSAYRTLALVHHPDKKAPGEIIDAAEFRRIHEAWELLKDEQAKLRYDNAYARVGSEWLIYRKEVVEFTQNPEAWRSKQASGAQARAQAASAQRSQAQYQYDDSDDDDEDWEDYEPGRWFRFGGHSWGDRPSQEEREKERREEKEAYSRFYEDIRKTDAQRMQARENANKRAIERQKKGIETQQEKSDGIRIVDLEGKLALAKEWVEGLQHKYAEELKTVGQRVQPEDSIDLGWDRKKGRQICHFCDALVHEYSFRCPSGGAIACRVCKKTIALSSPSQPFSFVNNGLNGKKGRGRKGKGKKEKKTRTRAEEEVPVDSEEPELGEQDVKESEADREGVREKESREQEARAEKARAREEQEARQKAMHEAQAKAILEKAARENAAREKMAAADKASREITAQKKEAEEKEAREKEAREKKAREKEAHDKVAHKKGNKKKAASERAAPNRIAQENVAQEEARQGEVQQEARHREEQKKEERAGDAQEMPDNTAGMARGNAVKEEEQGEGAEEEADAVAALHNKSITTDSINATKKPTKKALRLPPVCFTCNEEGHIARKCPTRSQNKKAPKNDAIPLKPTVKFPAAVESMPSPAGASSGLPNQGKARKPRPAKQTQQRPVNMRDTAHLAHIEETPVNSKSPGTASSSYAPVEGEAIKDSRKRVSRPTRPRGPLVCYTCNEEGHIARNCPTAPAATAQNSKNPKTKPRAPFVPNKRPCPGVEH